MNLFCRRHSWGAALALFTATLPGCGERTPATTDGGDAAADATPADVPRAMCSRTFTFEAGDPNGAPEPLTVAAGQSRAGRLRAMDLPRDRTGLSVLAAGDFVLANNRLAVMIEDAGPSALYDPWGGRFVGVARVEAGRLVDAADFNEIIFGMGRFTVQTRTVTVLRDGRAGGPAVVRALGTFRAVPFVDEFARALAPQDYGDIEAAIDYELAPDSDKVDVVLTLGNPRPDEVTVRTVLHAFFQRYRMPFYSPLTGFDNSTPQAAPWVGFIDDGAMSYAWRPAGGPITPLVSVSGFDAYTGPALTLAACDQTRIPFASMIVGGHGLDGLRQALARVEGTTLREVSGTVVDAAGMPAAGVRVHATRMTAMGHLTRATTDAVGAFTLHVPMETVQLRAFRAGDQVAGPVDVPVGNTAARLTLGPTGALHVVATEAGSMAPLPVRVQVLPALGDPPALPRSHGELDFGQRRVHVAFPVGGDVRLPLPPGRYQLVVSRGGEYELSSTEVTITAGMTTEAPVSLRRSVETPNVLCGDFHIHTNRSPDSPDPALFKLAAAAGDGLEIAARSDHEFVADWADLVTSMGLAPWIFGFPSLELTTFAWGHFGVVPLLPRTDQNNGGAFEWVGRRPPEVFAEVRRRPEAPTIIINHPSGAAVAGAYFTAAGYTAGTGTGRPEMWDNDFTAVEVFNASDFESNRMATVRDWFGMLNHNRRVFAVGSSDSHGLHPNSPVGYPRTCMYLGTDDPRRANANAIRDAVAQGRSYISGGIYLDVSAPGGQGPGQNVPGVGPMARLRVTVQAPAWVDCDRLEVIVDGESQPSMALGMAQRDPANPTVRFRGEVTAPVAPSGSWVVVVASGTRDLAPVHPNNRPFAVSNPIFLQR